MPFEDKIVQRGDAKFKINDDGDLYVLKEVYEDDGYRATNRIFPGAKVLDIGANKGIFSVWAGMQGASITAYEPNKKTFKYLIDNLEMNGVKDYVAFNRGVWSYDGLATFYPNRWNSGGSTFIRRVTNSFTEHSEETEVWSFDKILGNTEWDIVKIDTEGAEYEIIRGSQKLNQIKYLAMECHYWNEQGGNLSIEEPTGSEVSCSAPLYDRMVEKLQRHFKFPWQPLTQTEYPHGTMMFLERK